MARVPLQTGLTQQYKGSEVQLSAQTVDPFESETPDNLKTAGKALTSVSDVIGKLDDEINEAESKQLFNEFYSDLDTIRREYLDLKGALAVSAEKPETEGEEPKRKYDVYNERIETLLESYRGRSSNGEVKFMFENMASVSVKSAQSSMTVHSIEQQRIYNDNERKTTIGNYKNASIVDGLSWQDPESTHNTSKIAGLKLLEEQAIADGLITRGPKTSEQWLTRVSEYNMDIHLGTIEALKKAGKQSQIPQYIEAHRQQNEISDGDAQILVEKFREDNKEYNSEKIVDHVLTNNSPTDYSFENQSNLVLCLDSNNAEDNDNGGICVNGFHTNELDLSDFTEGEQVGILEQKRNESVYFQPDSKTRISEVNQPIHLFAIQHIGVEKADRYYAKALKQVDYDKEKYKNDEGYKREVDKRVSEKFRNLFIKEVDKKFTKKENALDPKPKRDNYPNTRSGSEQYQAAVEVWNTNNKKYVSRLTKDVNILHNGVRYKDVDPVSGLQPLAVYEELLKSTITDPKQLAFALEDLKLKHNAITQQKSNEYTTNLINAQEIAFAEPGGWKQLEANGIDINMFSEKDQAQLKKGQPNNSNKNVYIHLIENPGELKNNIKMYRTQLNDVDYAKLVAEGEKLQNNDDVESVSVDINMYKNELKLAGLENLYRSDRNENEQDDYIQIQDAWKKEIAEEEAATGKKVGLKRKREILQGILNNKVILDPTGNQRIKLGGKDYELPISAIDQDELDDIYVKVGGKSIWFKNIPKYQNEKIIETLLKNGIPPTKQNIATFWVRAGKPKAKTKFDMDVYSKEFLNSLK